MALVTTCPLWQAQPTSICDQVYEEGLVTRFKNHQLNRGSRSKNCQSLNPKEYWSHDIKRSNYIEAFQVSGPLSDFGSSQVVQTIFTDIPFENKLNGTLDYTFNYIAPQIDFNHVEVSWNVRGVGNQYDRLGHLYIGGCEIWRPSTAEPYTQVEFNYTKDVSEYLCLFQKNQVGQFQLHNYIEGTTTGIYYVTLKFLFYKSGSTGNNNIFSEGFSPPTNIVPLLPAKISQSNSYGYMFTLPESSNDSTVNIPQLSRNTSRAVLDIGASGNSDEEFWYTGIIDEYQNRVPGSSGTGPSRIIEIYINDHLAGSIQPFPIIYSGGLYPEFWSPMVGINVFDVPRYKIDITPFLPALWNNETSIKLRVVNGYNQNPVNQNWLVNANLMTWEINGVEGQGTILSLNSNNDDPSANGYPEGSNYYQQVQLNRTIRNVASLKFGNDNYTVSWFQNGIYANIQMHHPDKLRLDQHSYGSDALMLNKNGQSNTYYQFNYHYPLKLLQNQSSIDYGVFRSYQVNLNSNSVNANQNCTLIGSDTNSGEYYNQILNGESYDRHVVINNGQKVIDTQ